LVDLIRSGKAPEVIRQKGAVGDLPLPAEDRIEILAVLIATADTELSAQALATLKSWDVAEVRQVMANPQTAPDVLRIGAEQLALGRDGLREILFRNPGLPVESFVSLQRMVAGSLAEVESAAEAAPAVAEETSPNPGNQNGREGGPVATSDEAAVEILAKLAAGARIEDVTGEVGDVPAEATMRDDELTVKDRETLIEKIGRMTVVEKIKAALTGNMETRVLLIRDSNKIISRAVLQSPKISDTEAESYAAAKNVSEEVLRLIAASRKFMKSYTVMRALINNPRAPIDITMPLLIRINEKDLKGLTLNRNVPEVIRSLSIKMIKQREDATKIKLRR
jgi:hypothetical protein